MANSPTNTEILNQLALAGMYPGSQGSQIVPMEEKRGLFWASEEAYPKGFEISFRGIMNEVFGQNFKPIESAHPVYEKVYPMLRSNMTNFLLTQIQTHGYLFIQPWMYNASNVPTLEYFNHSSGSVYLTLDDYGCYWEDGRPFEDHRLNLDFDASATSGAWVAQVEWARDAVTSAFKGEVVSAGGKVALIGDENWQDYFYMADITLTSGGSVDANMGLMTRVKGTIGSVTGCYVGLFPDAGVNNVGQVQVWDLTTGSENRIVFYDVPLDYGVKYSVSLSSLGDRLRIYVNAVGLHWESDDMRFSFVSTACDKGKVGVHANVCTGLVDNVTVYPLTSYASSLGNTPEVWDEVMKVTTNLFSVFYDQIVALKPATSATGLKVGQLIYAIASPSNLYNTTDADWEPDPGALQKALVETQARSGKKMEYVGKVHIGEVGFNSHKDSNGAWLPDRIALTSAVDVLYVSGHCMIAMTQEDQTALKNWVESGGILFGDDCNNILDQASESLLVNFKHPVPISELRFMLSEKPIQYKIYYLPALSRMFELSFREEIFSTFETTLEELLRDSSIYSASSGTSYYGGTPGGTGYYSSWSTSPLEAITSGGRVTVLFSTQDYGCHWAPYDGTEKVQPYWHNAFIMGCNILEYVRGSRTDTIKIAQLYQTGLDSVFGHFWDYNPDPGALDNLCGKYKLWKGNAPMENKGFVHLTNGALAGIDMLYMTGHLPFSFTETERQVLRDFVSAGGFIFADDCTQSKDELLPVSYDKAQIANGHIETPNNMWREAKMKDGNLAVDRIPSWGVNNGGIKTPFEGRYDLGWVAVLMELELLYAQAIRVEFARLPTPLPKDLWGGLPQQRQVDLNKMNGAFPWSIEVRDLAISHRGYDKTKHIDSVREDVMGNIVTSTTKEWGAVKAVDGQELTFWKSSPSPVAYGKEYLFLDNRDKFGRPQLLDRIYIDPMTIGPTMNVYHSNDDSKSAKSAITDVQKEYSTSGLVVFDQFKGMSVTSGYYEVDIENFDAKSPWWVGAELYFETEESGVVWALHSDSMMVNAGLIWDSSLSVFELYRGFNAGIVQAGLIYDTSGQIVKVIAGFDGIGTLSIHTMTRGTSGHTSGATVANQTGIFDSLTLGGNPSTPDTNPGFRIKNFVFKQEAITDQAAEWYLGNPALYMGDSYE